MKKLIILNLLLTASICGKLDQPSNIIEDVVHHAEDEGVLLAYEMAMNHYSPDIVFQNLFGDVYQ